MSSQLVSYALKSTSGPVLDVNEDLVDINLVNNIYTIMDGFGGSGIGDVAVNFIKSKVLTFFSGASSDPDSTLPYFYDPKYILELNVLVNSIHYTHKEFMEDNNSRPVNLRAGASFIFSLYVDSLLMFVNVGNCTALLKRGGSLTQAVIPQTLEDPSYVGGNAAESLFPAKAFGLYDKLDLNISELKVQAGDQVLLCSDGVYAHQNLKEMEYILSKNRLTNAQKVQELIDLSNIRGNWDNQSIILLNF